MPGHGSQAGLVSFLADSAVDSRCAPVAILEWSSTRIKRVVKSTLAAEAAALAVAQDRNDHGRVLTAYMFGRAAADGLD